MGLAYCIALYGLAGCVGVVIELILTKLALDGVRPGLMNALERNGEECAVVNFRRCIWVGGEVPGISPDAIVATRRPPWSKAIPKPVHRFCRRVLGVVNYIAHLVHFAVYVLNGQNCYVVAAGRHKD